MPAPGCYHKYMNPLWLVIVVICTYIIAYRYYSGFIAAKVLVLDENRVTPAHRFYDGHNYYPTNKWVLFGHHFAAITGAGPLIGPVLAAQFGYLPGLLWLVIGVCLGGGVEGFLLVGAGLRRGGENPARISVHGKCERRGLGGDGGPLFIVLI